MDFFDNDIKTFIFKLIELSIISNIELFEDIILFLIPLYKSKNSNLVNREILYY